MRSVFYDDALPIFADLVRRTLSEAALDRNVFLRDAVGRLTFVCLEDISPDVKRKLANEAFSALRPYVDDVDYAVSTPDDLFDPELAKIESASYERIIHPIFDGYVYLFERRILGQDWLIDPQGTPLDAPPIFVFASIKGGVGRSTALSIVAADLSANGHNVLVIDLDLEAPGIGAMLLPIEALPKYGTLDFYVENGLSELDDRFYDNLIGVSSLTQGRGLVHVVPAIGSATSSQPSNALGKLARAYLEDEAEDGRPKTFLVQTRDLLVALARRQQYSVILVDVRAGLNETTAASLQGLSAEVLLFGINSSQTFDAYRLLFANLFRFRPLEPVENDWRLRLRMVHAKAVGGQESLAQFRDLSFELFADYLYDEALTADVNVNFNLDDADAPHFAWPIPVDSNYFEFDPMTNGSQFSEEVFRGTFGIFLRCFKERLALVSKQ